MAKRSTLRASDEDRDRVVQRLRQAAIEGRLLAHELDERLATALRARTYGDLDEVVSDLPGTHAAARRSTRTRELVTGHQLALVAAMAVIAVLAFAVLALVLAAFSGIWMVLLVFAVLHRVGHRGNRRARRGGGHRTRRGGGHRTHHARSQA